MKLSTPLTLLTSASLASAFHKGFNIGAERPDGSCKSQADWLYNFNVMKSFPGNFHDVRVYAASDCNTLANAVPAAVQAGIQILVGIWTQNDGHYAAEKAALEAAIAKYGVKWISAVSVGSEDLYRGDTTAEKLAGQIHDVRGMISQPKYGGRGIWVGHVDTYNAYNDSSAAVIKACDFIGMDAYPYWQGVDISIARQTFQKSIDETKAWIAKYNPGKPVWITETGWPAAGPNFGGSVSSVQNARSFWQQVLCGLGDSYATYWFTVRDFFLAPNAPSFGVVDANFKPLYPLTCP